jgi:hypothetical protein
MGLLPLNQIQILHSIMNLYPAGGVKTQNFPDDGIEPQPLTFA